MAAAAWLIQLQTLCRCHYSIISSWQRLLPPASCHTPSACPAACCVPRVFYLHLNCLLPLITAALKCNCAAHGAACHTLGSPLLLISATGLLKYAMIRCCRCRCRLGCLCCRRAVRSAHRTQKSSNIHLKFSHYAAHSPKSACVCVCVCLPQRGQSVHAHINAKNNRPPVCMLMSPPTKWSVCPDSFPLSPTLSLSLSLSGSSSCRLASVRAMCEHAIMPVAVVDDVFSMCCDCSDWDQLYAICMYTICSTMVVHAYLFKYSSLFYAILNTQLEQLKKAELWLMELQKTNKIIAYCFGQLNKKKIVAYCFGQLSCKAKCKKSLHTFLRSCKSLLKLRDSFVYIYN